MVPDEEVNARMDQAYYDAIGCAAIVIGLPLIAFLIRALIY